MEIRIIIKTSYGHERIYPVCDKARLFADISGRKVLTRDNLDKIKKLGYVIREDRP